MNYALLSTVVAAITLGIKSYGDGHLPASIDAATRSLIYSIVSAIIGVALAFGAYYGDPTIVGNATNPYFVLVMLGIASAIPGGIGSSILTLLGIRAALPTAQNVPLAPRSFLPWM